MYTTNINTIKKEMLEYYNELYRSHQVNENLARGILKIIYKKGDSKEITVYWTRTIKSLAKSLRTG